MRHTVFISLYSAILSFVISVSVQARTLGSYEGFIASVADNFACSQSALVRIDAPEGQTFDGNIETVSKLAGLVRVALSFECANINEIELYGYANNVHVVSTSLTSSTGWNFSQFENASVAPRTARVATSERSRTRQRGSRPAPSNSDDMVMSFEENGVRHIGTYRSDKAIYFERSADYRVRSIQAEISPNVQKLLDYWGIELEEVILKRYDGAKQTPFNNPTPAQQHYNRYIHFYSPDSPDNVDAFLPRIKTIKPGGLFDKLGAEVGDYIQMIRDGQTYLSRNMSITGYVSFNGFISELENWAKENNTPFRHKVVLSRMGFGAHDIWLDTAIVPAIYASFDAPKEPRKNETRFANLLPPNSLAHSRELAFQSGEISVLIQSMAEGSFARYLFWQREDNYLFHERIHELIFPAAAEAYSDLCRSSLVDPVTYTPVRNVFRGEEGVGSGVVTRYWERVKGKPIHLERKYLDLYQQQIADILPTLTDIHREIMGDMELVPFIYQGFLDISNTTTDFSDFFEANGCNPVATQFMENFANFLNGEDQVVEEGKYPAKIEVFAEAEEHVIAYAPENNWPKVELLPDTNYFGAEVIGQTRIQGNLRRMTVGLTELYSLRNSNFDRNEPGMPEAINEVFTTKSKGMECQYYGSPGYIQSRFFWYEMNPALSPETIELISSAGVGTLRDSCPARFSDP